VAFFLAFNYFLVDWSTPDGRRKTLVRDTFEWIDTTKEEFITEETVKLCGDVHPEYYRACKEQARDYIIADSIKYKKETPARIRKMTQKEVNHDYYLDYLVEEGNRRKPITLFP